MSSDEEYLDDLLKSVMENDEESNHVPEEDSLTDDVTTDEGNELNDLAITDVESELNDFAIADVESELDDFAIMDEGSELNDLAITDVESELDDFAIMDEGSELDDLAITDVESELNDFAIVDNMDQEDNISDSISSFGEELISPDEVDAMFAAANAAALDESASNANADADADDMLALLDSMSKDKAVDEEALLGDIFAGIEEHEANKGEIVQESEEKEKKKGKFSKIFGKKDKTNKDEKAADDLSDDEKNPSESENDESPKKQNFFSKVLAFLTEADDDDQLDTETGVKPSDENKNILDELNEEDKKKKKKKVKGKNQDDKDNVKEKKKEKKPKKKEKAEAVENLDSITPARSGKRISKKSIAVIIGLCLTLTAMIVVLCSIVPEFFDKRGAREAFYQSDYTKAYELLYGKKLDNSDTIIYNKSKIILELNRKLDSYHNYLAIGKEVQALDALMSGVEKYPDILFEAEEYHVTQEVNAIYQTILNILNDKYDLSEGVAKVIIAYDDLTYTRKLESVVYGTPFVKPEEEKETVEETVGETEIVADILPEEQTLMEENISIDTQEIENAEPEVTESVVSTEEIMNMDETNEPEEMESDYVQEDEMPSETSSDSVSYEPQNNTSGSQGQLIQGVRQPINIEIHGN